MIDRFQTRQSLQGSVDFASPCDLARRSNAPAVGVNPEADQQSWIQGASTRTAFQRTDWGVERIQVEPAYPFPYRTHRMLFND
jgi:hypothetical protein